MRRRAKHTGGRGRLRRGTMAGVAGVLAAAGMYGALAPRLAAGGRGPTVERVSVASNGEQGNDRSLLPAVNADGSVVAFKSSASNLVPDDRNQKVDVFVRDRSQQLTERVSLSDIPGAEPNDNSFPPALDHAGDVVAYASLAANILRGDFNLGADVFVYNRSARTTSPLTWVRDENGDARGGGGAPDLPPSLTADGRVVAFASSADDLVEGDNNETSDVFAYDRGQEVRILVSGARVGSAQNRSGNGPSAGAAIGASDCVVAFYSDASNLVSGDSNQFRDVFVRDFCRGEATIERVSVSTSNEEANRPSQAAGFSVALSADERYVAFASDASNLDAGDDNNTTDIFVRDREAATTTRVSKNANGESANGPSQFSSLSGDGRFVVFQSAASNLVDDDTNGKTDIFVVDRSDGSIRRVSLTSTGEQANGDSTSPQISVDGFTVVFQSEASNLVPDDTNGVTDVFAALNPLAGPPPPPTDTPTPTNTPTLIPTNTQVPTPTVPPDGTATPTNTNGPPTATATAPPTATTTALPPTATRTATTGATPPTATRTPTTGTPGPTVTRTTPRGGGGGCSCRIDGGAEPVADWGGTLAIGFPLLVWTVRHRQRRRR